MSDTTSTRAAETFKNRYNYHCIDNCIVVFSVPARVYRRHFGNTGFNTFVVCADEDDIIDTNCHASYKLCERERFRFRQFSTYSFTRNSTRTTACASCPTSTASATRALTFYSSSQIFSIVSPTSTTVQVHRTKNVQHYKDAKNLS